MRARGEARRLYKRPDLQAKRSEVFSEREKLGATHFFKRSFSVRIGTEKVWPRPAAA